MITLFKQFYSPVSVLSILLISLVSGCKSNTSTISHDLYPSSETTGEKHQASNYLMPESLTDSVYSGLLRAGMVFQFYQNLGYMLVWQDESQDSLFDSLYTFIRSSAYYGLGSARYHFNELSKHDTSRISLIRREALLTDAFLAMAHDLRHGQLSSTQHVGDSTLIPLLLHVLNRGHLKERLESQAPKMDQYIALKTALRITLDSLHAGLSVDEYKMRHRIKAIDINLERWRRELYPFPERYLIVNIPSFSLQIIDNDEVVLTSRVIVGKPGKPTPVLASRIECISIYPYWHVPRNISVEEFLPILQKDTSFLRRNNLEVLDRYGKLIFGDTVQWLRFSANYFPLLLRQREGPDNALGVIKFMFDNPYSVYLHDTNNRELFRRDRRAFSHGCVRVENAIALAHYLVTGKPNFKSKQVDKYLEQKQAHQINLQAPIAIYIRYFTCAYENNVFKEFNDVYGLDNDIEELLCKSGDLTNW